MREVFKKRNIKIAKLIHYIILLTTMLILTIINNKFYGDAYRLVYIWPIGLATIAGLLIFNRRLNLSMSANITVLISIVILILFVIHKPTYSVSRVRKRIGRELDTQLIYSKEYSNSTNKAGKYISRYYIYKMGEDKIVVYDPELDEYIVESLSWIDG